MHASALPEHAAPLAAPTRTSVGRITAPTLVDATWLLAHREAIRIVDTRAVRAFDAGHLPGSVSLPLDALLVDDSSRPALVRLAAAARITLAARGLRPDEHVALVDDGDGSAALGATICELAGMRHVSVVHGSGIDAWRVLGGELATGDHGMSAVAIDAWDDVSFRHAMVAAFEDLVDAVVDGTAIVLDARSQLEHEGIVGAPCCASRGAIPGSHHVEWTSLFDMFATPHSPGRVREILAHVGIGTDDHVIVTCHAGHRAATSARVLRSAGFRNVRVSIGSWHEWSARGLADDEPGRA